MKEITKDDLFNALLRERLMLIKRVVTEEHDEEEFAMSWSGGKDSCVMSALFDMALPNNRIPRVYANTALDLSIMRDFIKEEMKRDDRIVEIKPTVNVKEMLERDGYPFSSKKHSKVVSTYQRLGFEGSHLVRRYLGKHEDGRKWSSRNSCPKCLEYMFTPEFTKRLKVSNLCCKRMKEEPIDKWVKENGYKYGILGLMAEEGGLRSNITCFAFRNNKFKNFQPLAPLTKEWEDWFVEKYEVRICDIYKPPYNNQRTGCKGCPFSLHLQEELDMLQEYFPNDRKACEKLWKPVYDEYRRIGYRLKKGDVYEAD